MTNVFRKLCDSAAGDTIVEVMISMAVLGATLGISYAIANNSLNQSRAAQERTQVVKILQSQLELLRASAGLPNTNVYTTPGQFCFYADNTGKTQIASWPNPNNPPTTPSVDGHGPCTQGFYNYYITHEPNDTFSATGVWDNAMGTGKDTATLVYRLHPAS